MYRIIVQFKHLIIGLLVISFSGQIVFPQTHSSRNNYTGDWEQSSSWNPVWNVPQTSSLGGIISINGYITVNGSLSFSGSASQLIIYDTLVIKGNLTLGDNNDLTINDNGILIIGGSLSFGNQTIITANGYLIITSDIIKNSSIIQGSITSNDDPVKIFVEGTIPTELTGNNALYSAIDCISPVTMRYPASNCSYGNMTDLLNDPVYSFFQTTCLSNSLPAKPIITASGPLTFCSGDSVTLTSSSAAGYLWSNGSTSQGIDVKTGDQYFVQVINTFGCRSASSAPAEVIVNKSPVAVPGPDQELKFTFETQMNAELSASETGEWSLVSGSAHIIDIHSPATRITGLDFGENIFRWKVDNSNCETIGEVKITVNDQFVPSVITPNGDGKNDFFKISEYTGTVQLIIINRWGNEEYSNSDYSNDWDGRNNKGIELPADTYFYILKFDNGKVLKGAVLVKR